MPGTIEAPLAQEAISEKQGFSKVVSPRQASGFMQDAARMQQDENLRGGLIYDKEGQQRLTQWLREPVAYKTQTGADKHRQLLLTLLDDLTALKITDVPGWIDTNKTVLPAFFLYLAHNATSLPPQGFGRVQSREAENPLFYFRSQSRRTHVHETFYFELLQSLQTFIQNQKFLLLPNSRAIKGFLDKNFRNDTDIWLSTNHTYTQSPAPIWQSAIKKVNNRPFRYRGPVAGYVGLRRHNAAVYSLALGSLSVVIQNVQKPEAWKTFLEHFKQFIEKHYFDGGNDIPLVKNIVSKLEKKQNPDKQLASLLQQITEDLGKTTQAKSPVTGTSLLSTSLQHRSSLATQLATYLKDEPLKYLQVFHVKGNPNLVMQLKPPPYAASTYKVEDSYHTQGWVNTVLAYCGGLLNFFAAQQTLPVYTDRRQSFGFLRPTLTDTGPSIRLSLGAQPLAYTAVVLQALYALDAAIDSLEFATAQEAFSLGWTAPSHGRERTYNHLTYSMEAEERQLGAFVGAERLIAQDAQPETQPEAQKEPVQPATFETYVALWQKRQTFTNYIKQLIAANTQSKALTKKTPPTDLTTQPQSTEQAEKNAPSATTEPPPTNQQEAKVPSAPAIADKINKFYEGLDRTSLCDDLVMHILDGVLDLVLQTLTALQPQQEQPKESTDAPNPFETLFKTTSWPKTLPWTAIRMVNNVQKAFFLKSASEVMPGQRYSKALLIIESLLENLILLRAISRLSPQIPLVEEGIKKQLLNSDITDQDLTLYRCDSGEQAGAACIFAAVQEALKGKQITPTSAPYKIETLSPYFEFHSLLGVANLQKGKTVLGTMADLHPGLAEAQQSGVIEVKDGFAKAFESLTTQGKQTAYTLIIDITQADIHSPEVQAGIKMWVEKRKTLPSLRLVLISSLLKHAELGLDKYQAGRIYVFGKPFALGQDDYLAQLHQETLHPLINDYLWMTQQVNQRMIARQ